jgi:hypothetical protein
LPPPSSEKIDFRKHIYPLLVERCFQCHKGAHAKSDYRLDVRSAILGEIDGQPLAVPGKSAESMLVKVVAGQVKGKTMPPAGKGERLSPEEIGLVRAWVDQGLAWDESLLPARLKVEHWAFKPVQKPAPPSSGGAWVRNPIDAFIAQQHEAKGLKPAPEAERSVLIRRLYLDLIGLPPNIEEMDRAANDASAQWYEDLVERLLASPHYGERWGRHWLDVARYADSEGYENDALRPFAWRYRDYVVKSFNDDKPYDLFIRQQLAGDELMPYSDENLIATGFLAGARFSGNEEDKLKQRSDVLIDIVNATASALLGLSMHCAQCHNHKWDPLTQRDYYRFYGFFVKGQMNNLLLKDGDLWKQYEASIPRALAPAEQLRQTLFDQVKARLTEEAKKKLPGETRTALQTAADKRTPKQQELAKAAEKGLQFKTEDVEKAIPAEDKELYAALKKRIESLKKELPEKPQTIGFYSPTGPHQVDVITLKANYPLGYVPDELKKARPYLFVRGDPAQKGPELDVGWPAVFGPTPAEKVGKAPRTALAEWLADPANPLTARAWVNRIWAYHFGRGIVATPGDFGTKGARPTHPELLDYLAAELIGLADSTSSANLPSAIRHPQSMPWSTKHIHRLIVCSSTYRQSAAFNSDYARIDPDNQYLWRWAPRRLESEAIRDSVLAVSGELARQIGGPGVPLVERNKYTTVDPPREREGVFRRSLYIQQMRDGMPPMQQLFDGPTANESCPRRHVSTVSLQPLFLLNSDYMLNRARTFANRVAAVAGSDHNRQIETAYQLALGRKPVDQERQIVKVFFEPMVATDSKGQQGALVQFCHMLLNLNEFIYVE